MLIPFMFWFWVFMFVWIMTLSGTAIFMYVALRWSDPAIDPWYVRMSQEFHIASVEFNRASGKMKQFWRLVLEEHEMLNEMDSRIQRRNDGH